MGLFSRRQATVRVAFRDLWDDRPLRDPGDAGSYAYRWPTSTAPGFGTWVWVPGGDGRPSTAIVVGIATPAQIRKYRLVTALREVTRAEYDAARQKHAQEAAADETAWLNMMRRAAGLPTRGRARGLVPEGYPKIPDASGTADPTAADEYGRVWWRAWKRAEDADRDPEEIEVFRDLAYRWFAIRDHR